MEEEKKPIYKKWWFWVIIIVVIAMVGVGENSNTANTINNIETINNNEKKSNDTYDNQEIKVEENSTYKTSYKWECTKDIRHEQIEETEILAVEADVYDGINLESGKYKISYSYEDYTSTLGLETTNKYNRFYFVYVTNELMDVNTLLSKETKINKGYTFSPTLHDEQTIQLERGQYIYIQHTPQKEAGYGTIELKKISN